MKWVCASEIVAGNSTISLYNVVFCISWNCICVNKKVKQVNAALCKESIILVRIIRKPCVLLLIRNHGFSMYMIVKHVNFFEVGESEINTIIIST